MGRFLIWLSGANREVLAKTPGEVGKYEGLGGVVLTTASMAALSAGLAINLALQASIVVCVLVGLFWGLAILNLDRWLISAFPRRDALWKNFLQALPRFLMALLIGVVVSTPLVLRVFNNEINDQLRDTQNRKLTAAAQRIVAAHDIPKWEQKVADDTAAINARSQADKIVKDQRAVRDAGRQLEAARRERKQALNSGDTSEVTRLETLIRVREEQYGRTARSEVARLNKLGKQNIAHDTAELQRHQREQKAELAASREAIEKNQGLLERIRALGDLRAERGDVQAAYLVLWAFITLIEVLPVLLKFLMTLGAPSPYEVALVSYNRDQIKSAEQHIEHQSKAREEELAARARLRTKQTEMSAELGEQELRRRLDRANQRSSGSALFGP
ncbi:DUF4407 domain-containing protein [Cryptosporangium aurantiacum]|uniref:DUF4407 domain-containing protein n=1 Tax=Cryptosporangium aurantiacum TaxID=134849 RepID=A0A1M7RHY2_9ACTN|nr:DUF4407 domain-containing protein [Cryptosporangium aurantiacum]SHN45826.1 protein of unknown function [Cryptosporangium aurantiacum]